MGTISIDLPETAIRELRRLADEHATTVEAMAAEALLDLLITDPELEAAIAEAEAEIAEGKLVPAEQVFAELDAIIAAAKARKGG